MYRLGNTQRVEDQTGAVTQLSGSYIPLHYIKVAIHREFGVMTERMRSHMHPALMSFFRRMTGLGFRGKLRSLETGQEASRAFPFEREPCRSSKTCTVDYIFHLAWDVLRFPGSLREVLLKKGCLKSRLPL